MFKSSYEVEILINGKPAKEYRHDGKVFIEGREKTKFSIKVRNNSYSRKLFVPTVDGLSVMNGEEASYKSSGYIVSGYNSITIDGWRTSDESVAEFFFSSPEGSYRKEMDKGNNIGMIGVAVFDEVYHAPAYTYYPCYHTHYQQTAYPTWITTANAQCGTTPATATGGLQTSGINNSGLSNIRSAFSMSKDNNQSQAMMCSANAGSSPMQALGTGFGESKRSEVTSAEFERVGSPDTVFEIYYNTREELEKAGICMKKETLYVTPQAFPGQYCKPPQRNCYCGSPSTCKNVGCHPMSSN